VSVSADVRQIVRQRAGCACEFCYVREQDAGATLTIDHFQPRSKGGSDALDNLVYAFTEAENGQLIALTIIGTFTIGHLRLNRSQLVAQQLLMRYQEVITSLDYLNSQLESVVDEQKRLLTQQQRLIWVLLQQR
jgi:hypothetical protein